MLAVDVYLGALTAVADQVLDIIGDPTGIAYPGETYIKDATHRRSGGPTRPTSP